MATCLRRRRRNSRVLIKGRTMHIYHLKSCDTCKKAIKALADHNPQLTDVRADGVAPELLSDWLSQVGTDVLLNRKSTTWRNLSDDERAGDPLKLLIDHPTLMKRPVVVENGNLHVGWSPENRLKLGA